MASVMRTSAVWMAAMAPFFLAPAVDAQSWRLDRSTFDTSADACRDFYQYVCGGWSGSAPIRTDRPEAWWARDQAEARDREALSQLLTGHDEPRNAELARVRTFFASCMTQSAAAESADRATLEPWLTRIDAVDSRERLMATLRDLHSAGISVLFQYSGEPDRNDRSRFRAEIHQAVLGLWLPLYSDAIPRAQERRNAYRAQIARMFELSGAGAEVAKRDADATLRLELALAAASLSFSDRFDPGVSEHVMTVEGLTRLAPHFDWRPFLELVGYRGDRPINVTSTKYLERVDQLLGETPMADWRAFLRWQLLNALGSALPDALANQYTQSPRFDECQLATMKAMGVELSRQYSLRLVGKRTRNQAKAVVEGVRAQTGRAALQTAWLSESARRDTQQKIDELSAKTGFPDTWPATGTFPLHADAFLENTLAARAFEQRRVWQRVHAPRQRDSWEITVYPNAAPGMAAARLVIPNGYPDVFTNSIVLTSAYLRPPLFDSKAPLEVQYGSFGTLVGHELVHVLENHQYDHLGETHDLWSAADSTAHDARMDCVRDQANQFVVLDNLHLDGTRTADENIADFAGVAHAYAALSRGLGNRLAQRGRDGFTRAQRFFVAYAQTWCTAERPEYLRQVAARDPHAPNRFRVNAPLSNMPAFAAAFSCNAGAPMARPIASRCAVW